MGTILIYAGTGLAATGILLLLVLMFTNGRARKKLLEEIDKEYQ